MGNPCCLNPHVLEMIERWSEDELNPHGSKSKCWNLMARIGCVPQNHTHVTTSQHVDYHSITREQATFLPTLYESTKYNLVMYGMNNYLFVIHSRTTNVRPALRTLSAHKNKYYVDMKMTR